MKQLITLFVLSLGLSAQAQELLPDQNPNYLISKNKYMQQKDSLGMYMNTTIQNTYKAHDWYEARQERRQVRFDNRMQRRLWSAQNTYWINDGWGWNNNRWNGVNDWRWRNRWARPGVGFRTGNWWFMF
jgi:hypothetical protein